MDDLAAWLREHDGHAIAVDFNGENPELRALDADPDVRARAKALWDDADARRAHALVQGTLVRGIYTVACQACDESVAAPDDDVLQPLTAWVPTPAAIDAFVKRWGESDDMFAHRLGGALDQYEFIPELVAFFEEHATHALRVSIEGSKSS